jgi:predicted amidohydrolase YtcJ
VRECIDECLATGLTGIHEMGAELYALASYRRLLERGEFPFRNYVAVARRSESTWSYYRERGPERFGADGRLTIGAVKLLADGALGSRGAALHDSYCDDPGNTGLVLVPGDEVEGVTLEAGARGFQVCVHAIGDRANRLVLDAFERALARAPRPDHRLRVEHAQILASDDIPRFRRLGVLPSMQATHCTSDMAWAEERLAPSGCAAPTRGARCSPPGVVIAGGSDFPVESPNPFYGIHASVTRRPRSRRRSALAARAEDDTRRGRALVHRVERLRVPPGIRAGDARARQARRSDRALGGRLHLPGERIAEIRPVLTMVGGDIVYAG